MKSIWGTLVICLFVAMSTSLVLASGEQKIVAGKKGEIVLSEPTQFGSVTLPAGHYQVQHKVVGGEHFIHLAALKMLLDEHAQRGATKEDHKYPDIPCRTEPLNHKAAQTAVHTDDRDGTRRVTRVEVRGENVAHVF